MPETDGYSYVNVLMSNSGNGRFGLTPFWNRNQVFSLMTLESIGPDAVHPEQDRKLPESSHTDSTELKKKYFRLGDVGLTCRQYSPQYQRGYRYWLGNPADN